MFGLIRWSILREYALVYWICYALVLVPKNVAFVLAGSWVAPRARPTTAVVLAGLAILIALVVHLINRRGTGFTNYQDFAFETIGAVAAAAWVAVASFRKRSCKMSQGVGSPKATRIDTNNGQP